MTGPTPEEEAAARRAIGWAELGIPFHETHYHQPLRVPHRSRWRLMAHSGPSCVWIRVRIPRSYPGLSHEEVQNLWSLRTSLRLTLYERAMLSDLEERLRRAVPRP